MTGKHLNRSALQDSQIQGPTANAFQIPLYLEMYLAAPSLMSSHEFINQQTHTRYLLNVKPEAKHCVAQIDGF